MSSLSSWFKKRRSRKSRTPQTTPTPPVQSQPPSPTQLTHPQLTPTTPSSPQPPSQSILPDDPSIIDHGLGTSSTVLAFLKGVAEITSIPPFKGVVDIALTLVETTRATRANISGSAELAYHAAYLTKELCESCPKSPNEGVQRAIDEFTKELKDIGDNMKKLSLKSNLKGFVVSKTDTDNIKAYRDSLNMAYNKFTMSLTLNMIQMTSNIERRLETGVGQDPSFLLPSVAMPPKPKIFFGREDYVDQVVDVIVGKEDARVAILGSGGMGKTSIALAVMQDPLIADIFDEDHRHWVPCEKATSPEFLVGLLAKSANVPKASSDLLRDVVKTLRTSGHRHLFLLDNFETLMDIKGKRAESEAIISAIDLPNVNILITMRGVQPPSTGFQWTCPSLQVLALDAARQTFVTICPGSETDNRLDELLQELDCVPLAVNLMASLGNLGETPTELVGRWKEERTPLLHRAEDRLNSVDHSIRLSLESNPVQSNPEAVQLLSILSMLPGGAQRHLIKEIAPRIKNLNGSLDILLRVSLAHRRPDNSMIHVLSPIRSYMLHHHQLDPAIRQDIYKTYYVMAGRGMCMGEPEFVDAVQELSKEEANLEAVLLDALEYGDGREAVTASLEYSWYLYGTTPRIAVLSGAIAIAKKWEYDELYAKCVKHRGEIHYKQSRYDEAQLDLQAARDEFKRIDNRLGIAQCLKSLGNIHLVQNRYDEAQADLQEALDQFKGLGDQLGAAQCLKNLGNTHLTQNRYDEAQSDLQEARDQFKQLGNQLGAAQCLKSLGNIHLKQNRYGEAQSDLQEARDQFRRLGDQLGAVQCLKSLGNIHRMQGRYDEAQSNLQQARDEFKRLGNQLGVAQCHYSLGNIHLLQDRYDEAQVDLQAARDQFKQVGDKQGAARSLKSLERIHQRRVNAIPSLQNLDHNQNQKPLMPVPLDATPPALLRIVPIS